MTATASTHAPDRLDHVDGLRAIAIIWVAIYHYAAFWTPAGAGTNLTPYGDALAWIPLAEVGFLGVYLFFIVSGFVISISLTRSRSISRFVTNRAIRLWPTMLICGTITFAATTLLGPSSLMRTPLEYLISLTFIPPQHIGRIIGVADMQWLDGAYWSLWTEVRFYIIAALFYFATGGRFLRFWTGFALLSSVIHLIALTTSGYGPFDALSRLIFAEHQPYFTAGIALATMRQSPGHWGGRCLIVLALLQAVIYLWLANEGLSLGELVGVGIVFALAIPTMLARGRVPVLSSPLMVTLGVASYAYYLLHQNVGLALLTAFTPASVAGSIALMLIIQAGLILFSIALTRWLEVPLRGALRRMTAPRLA